MDRVDAPVLFGPIVNWVAKAGTFTVASTDRGVYFDNTGSYTINLTAAATLGAGFTFYTRTVSGTQVIDPAGAELINGAATLSAAVANVVWMVVCTGTAWEATQMPADSLNLAGTTSAASATTGTLTIGNGVAATSVGLGGGNVNAGGTGTFVTTVQVNSAANALFIANAATASTPGIRFQVNSVTASQITSSSTGSLTFTDSINTTNPLAYSPGAIGVGFWTFANTLDASSATVAGLVGSGGLAIAKQILGGSSIIALSATGTVVAGDGTGTAGGLRVAGAAATSRDLAWYTGSGSTAANLRHRIRINATAESGANAGSDVFFIMYDDTGATIDNWLFCTRAAGGTATSGRPWSFSGTTDATSATAANLITAGGLGVAKAVFIGTNLTLVNGAISQTITDAVTNTVSVCQTLKHLSSGTVAVNFGINQAFQAQDDAGVNRNQGTIRTLWTNAGTAAFASSMQFGVSVATTMTIGLKINDTSIQTVAGFPLSVLDTTEATSVSAAAATITGGFGAAKRSFLGTIGSTFKGNVLAGVQDATAAVAGQVGETLTSVVTGVAVAATGTVGNITSISVTAGAWLPLAFVTFQGGATGLTASSNAQISIVTTTATNGAAGSTMAQQTVYATVANGTQSLCLALAPINISASATYFLTEQVTFAAGSPTAAASLIFVRIR